VFYPGIVIPLAYVPLLSLVSGHDNLYRYPSFSVGRSNKATARFVRSPLRLLVPRFAHPQAASLGFLLLFGQINFSNLVIFSGKAYLIFSRQLRR